MPKQSGLGRGLDSLIPKKVSSPSVSKSSPPIRGTEEDVLHHIPIGQIYSHPMQPRKAFDQESLEELASSIREHGIIQPLIVAPLDIGYQIIAGERRHKAAKIAGLRALPCIVRNVQRHQQLELSLIENIQRKNLNPVEEALAYQRLLNEFNFTHQDLAQRLGKSRPVISNTLRLLNLPQEMQKAIIEEKIHPTVGRFLAGLPPKEQERYFHKALHGGLAVHVLEGHAKSEKITPPPRPYIRKDKDPNIIAQEEKLKESLGTLVAIQKTGHVGKIVISFYSEEEFRGLIEKLKSL